LDGTAAAAAAVGANQTGTRATARRGAARSASVDHGADFIHAAERATAKIVAKPIKFTAAADMKPRPTTSRSLPAIHARATLETNVERDCRPMAATGASTGEAIVVGKRSTKLRTTYARQRKCA
jgi:hypothetical protein